MKKGIGRIIIGAVFVILQIMSIAGNAKAGISTQLSFDSLGVFLYDLIFFVSYYFVGIVGVILLVSGIRALRRGQEEPIEDELVVEDEKVWEANHSVKKEKTGHATKHGTTILCMIVLILVLISVIVFQSIRHDSEIVELTSQIAELKSQIKDLNISVINKSNELSSVKWELVFYDMYVVFVSDKGGNIYHNIRCEDCDRSSFLPYHIEHAEQMGYLPCPKCH